MSSKQATKRNRDFGKLVDKLYQDALEIAKGGKNGISLMTFSKNGFGINQWVWHQSLKQDMLDLTKNFYLKGKLI